VGEVRYWINRVFLAFAVLALVGAGLGFGYVYLFGDGTLHVVAPSDGGLTVEVDGRSVRVGQGEHGKIPVKHGKHHVKVQIDGNEPLEFADVPFRNGFSEEVVPVDPDQCFVELEVSDAFYGAGDKLPTVRNRHPAQPFALASSTYLRAKELPSSVDEGSAVALLVPMHCDDSKLPDAKVLELLDLDKKH